jgi:hypothetical protein
MVMLMGDSLLTGLAIPPPQKLGTLPNSQFGLQLRLGFTPVLFVPTGGAPAFQPDGPGPLCNQVMGQYYGRKGGRSFRMMYRSSSPHSHRAMG